MGANQRESIRYLSRSRWKRRRIHPPSGISQTCVAGFRPVRSAHHIATGRRGPVSGQPSSLILEPALRGCGLPKGLPSPNFARVRRGKIIDSLPCCMPMRLVLVRQSHVNNERISVVGTSDPISAGLRFQFHRAKGHSGKLPLWQEHGDTASMALARSSLSSRIRAWG